MLQGGEGEAPGALSSPSGARVLSMGRIVSLPPSRSSEPSYILDAEGRKRVTVMPSHYVQPPKTVFIYYLFKVFFLPFSLEYTFFMSSDFPYFHKG